MLFNSLSFFIFFPIVTIGFFILPHRFRWAWLLLASVVFYTAFIPVYIFILAALILIDYVAAFFIEKAEGTNRKWFLGISIAANLGLLAFFKYYGFMGANVEALASFLGWNYSLPALKFILPLGLSFHTFQAMSYTIEVYRRRVSAERHLGIYALYVMFYPQLVAGPIERPYNLLPQLHTRQSFDYERVVGGLRLMLWGLFKKVVIADRAAIFVDAVYNHAHDFSGLSFVVATILFAIQIYGDFSGYTDMAIGAAEVMGVKLMKNFERPYFAKSVSEFWRRWHISLSSWFRDYVYIPLGGSRVAAWRHYLNIFVVFLVSGLWHGADWKFVIWGGLHGLYVALENLTAIWRARIKRWLGLAEGSSLANLWAVVVTFALTSLAWIFFRAGSASEALYIIRRIFGGFYQDILKLGDAAFVRQFVFLGQPLTRVAMTLGVITLLFGAEWLSRRDSITEWWAAKSALARWAIGLFIFWAIIFLGQFGEKQFIYFVF